VDIHSVVVTLATTTSRARTCGGCASGEFRHRKDVDEAARQDHRIRLKAWQLTSTHSRFQGRRGLRSVARSYDASGIVVLFRDRAALSRLRDAPPASRSPSLAAI
jgi:hypothetical protein